MNTTNPFVKLVVRKWWLRHALFWFTVINLLAWAFGFKRFTVPEAYGNAIAFIPGALILVYPLLYFLIPAFLIKKRFLAFFSCFALLLIPVYAISFLIEQIEAFKPVLNKGFNLRVGNYILPYVQIAGYAASLKLLKYFYFEEDRAVVATREKVNAELELLKAQIHPQFLFNTLRNLASHASENSPEAPQIVLKLSELLRFIIYESKTELIPLDNEIELLKNYLELEKLRLGSGLEVSYSFSGQIKGKKIGPLLILPIVEHCINRTTRSLHDQRWISLVMHVNKQILQCTLATNGSGKAEDSIPSVEIVNPELTNVSKRLNLLYPACHSMTIRDEEDLYLISIEVDLSGDFKDFPAITSINSETNEPEVPVSR